MTEKELTEMMSVNPSQLTNFAAITSEPENALNDQGSSLNLQSFAIRGNSELVQLNNHQVNENQVIPNRPVPSNNVINMPNQPPQPIAIPSEDHVQSINVLPIFVQPINQLH